jgi:gliding motility-associated-like protein
MTRSFKICTIASLAILAGAESLSQPVWITGTPSVVATGAVTIDINYGIDRTGTVYVIVFDFNNTAVLTSSYVRLMAISGQAGEIVAAAVLNIKRGDINKILETTLNVNNPGQVYTIYVVAADSKGLLQPVPVRLNATTHACSDVNPGSGGEVCGLSFTLNAVPVLGGGIWSNISGPGNVTFVPNNKTPDATVSAREYGTYVFRWTESAGGCTNYADITVIFYNNPSGNAGTGGDECGLEFALNATPGPGTGIWTMTAGTGTAMFLPDAGDPNATVRVTDYGTKTFTWTEVNGPCTASSSVTVNFYSQPTANAGNDQDNCGLQIYLAAIPSLGAGTWTLVSGPGNVSFSPDSETPNARATVTAYGTYILSWTEVNGSCTSSDRVTIDFFEFLSANAGNGGDECDLNFQLNAVPGSGTGSWSQVAGPGNATFSPDNHHADAIVSVSAPGSYDFAWTEVNFNCNSTDIIRVVFHEPPYVNAGQDTPICTGTNINLHATGSGSFIWQPADILNNPSIADPIATPLQTTLFTVTITDQWGCVNSDQVSVEVWDRPTPNAGPDQTLDFVFSTYLHANDPKQDETGVWSVFEGAGSFDNINDNNTKVSELSKGNNSLIWKITNGICPAMADTVNIFVKELIIPTMITPNLDGKNDFFYIGGIETLGKTELIVFNRWGAIMFEKSDYKNDWNGSNFQGDPLPEDTYFYILKPEKSDEIKGYIVIRR